MPIRLLSLLLAALICLSAAADEKKPKKSDKPKKEKPVAPKPKKKDPEPKESQAVMWKRRMLYLHPAVDKELRDLAHSDEERLHTILLRAIDFYLTTGRGKPSYLESLAPLIGQGVTETEPDGKAAQEIQEVWKWIAARL